MYYERHGTGRPLIVLPGAYMTIDLMGAVVPGLAQTPAYARQVFAAGGDVPGEDVDRSVTERVARQAVLNSERDITILLTEGALLTWLASGGWVRTTGFEYIELRTEHPVLYQVHFSSDRKRMTTVAKVKTAPGPLTLVKGAPEAILAECRCPPASRARSPPAPVSPRCRAAARRTRGSPAPPR